jgi:pimeloyl-ACP methyl ester carboxylesterase
MTFPPLQPSTYRVRYEGSTEPGQLVFAVSYTVWIPPKVKSLRGVIVHQHGCGEGSCRSGLTGAFDLHWQALAQAHDCALIAAAYEQPEGADCQLWCDPRNGSGAKFQAALEDLSEQSGHPELATLPWALWGHSGGGHWAGGMLLLHPERTIAAWLRSGVPLLDANPERSSIQPHQWTAAALRVPIMCNLGTKEGVTDKAGRFAGVWPANEAFFTKLRGQGALIGVAVDPLTSHECGNQRYLAIPWLDACLSARLPNSPNQPLRDMSTESYWLAPPLGTVAASQANFDGDALQAGWLPNDAIATKWMQYVQNTEVADTTAPPPPTHLQITGTQLTWQVAADLESGLAGFIIQRDGELLAKIPENGKNPFGRPLFQNLQYSDTPAQPLVPMQYTDATADPDSTHAYRVIAINTVGLQSPPSTELVVGEKSK